MYVLLHIIDKGALEQGEGFNGVQEGSLQSSSWDKQSAIVIMHFTMGLSEQVFVYPSVTWIIVKEQ